MTPHLQTRRVTLHHGDCREVLATLPDASVDAVVTDPPYGISFMGKEWDRPTPGGVGACTECGNEEPADGWRQCLQCLEAGAEPVKRYREQAPMLGQISANWHEKATHSRGYADNDNHAFQLWCQEWATEVLRVLKPGGHLLAFGGTRTYHRLACAIEDAGFEIRDSIHWLYGSGFPKSLDVSKAIDKQRDDRAEIYKVTGWVRAARDAAGITNRDIDAAFGFSGMAGHWSSAASQPAVPTLEQVPTLLDVLGVAADEVPEDVRRLLWDLNGRKGQPGENWARREVVGEKVSGIANRDEAPRHTIGAGSSVVVPITAPATDAARQWQGWGTALKPAHEPVVVARKPLVGTVAANVLAHGTGALNIDGCRVGTDPVVSRGGIAPGSGNLVGGPNLYREPTTNLGRWPANVVLDGEAAAELDRQSGDLPGAYAMTQHGSGTNSVYGKFARSEASTGGDAVKDSGGASRFFFRADLTDDDLTSFRYTAKPDRAERDAGLGDLEPVHRANGNKWTDQDYRVARGERPPSAESGPRQNFHPTVKPLDLMRWLVRLVTPPGGVVLDPFAGSGTTLAAAVLEDRQAVGIELTDDYLPIIAGRVAWAEREARFGAVQGPTKVRKETPGAVSLFDEVDG